MRILAVDTATRSCSIALLEDQVILAETYLGKGRTHSRHLLRLIESTLDRVGVEPAEIDGYAVTKGPGSFTGLRIGISTVKGIAYASGKPLVGISSLDALAFQFTHAHALVCPLLDARKHEVYYALYQFKDGRLDKKTEEQAADPQSMIDKIRLYREKSDSSDLSCIFLGDGVTVYRDLLQVELGLKAQFVPGSQNRIKAGLIGNLGLERLASKQYDPVDAFVPSYIRKSDAELSLKG